MGHDKKNDAEKTTRAHVAEYDLRSFLSQTFVIYMKTYALHWNYVGPKFFSVHKMTEEQYEELAGAVDLMAERMRALGDEAPVSLKQILEHADLREFTRVSNGESAIRELAKSHRLVSELAKKTAEAAEKANDLFTHDLLVARVGVHDKFAWMLESFGS